MQRADAWIAAPGEHELPGTAHADELVVKEVGRHLDEGQPASSMPDDLVARGIRDEMGKSLHRYGIAVPDAVLHGFGQGQETRHQVKIRLGWLELFTGHVGRGQMAYEMHRLVRPCAGHPRLATCKQPRRGWPGHKRVQRVFDA